MILLIDNYDSFVHNLARHFERLGQETVVVRNDAITPAGVRALRPQAIVLSPGPCTPREAGCSVAVAGELAGEIPLLGRLLGPSGHRRGDRRAGRSRTGAATWADIARESRRARRYLPECRRRSRRAATIR